MAPWRLLFGFSAVLQLKFQSRVFDFFNTPLGFVIIDLSCGFNQPCFVVARMHYKPRIDRYAVPAYAAARV